MREEEKGKITTEDVEKMRQRIQVWDILRYPMMFKDIRGKNMFSERWVPVLVVGKYPYLVEVLAEDGRRCTITYVDMLLEPKITKKIMSKGKRGRWDV